MTKKTRGRGRPVAERPLSRGVGARLDARVFDAFTTRAKRERRKPSDLLRIMVEDALVQSGDLTPE